MSDSSAKRTPLLLALALVLAVVLIAVLWADRKTADESDEPDSATRERQAEDRSRQAGARERGEGPRADLQGAPGVILGRVTDLDGQALSGAQVCARHDRMYADSLRPRCARTDAEGRYQLADLPPGAYQVHASAAKHQPLDVDRALRAGAEARADFELLAGAVLVRGAVYDLSGGAIEGAVVRLGGDRVRSDPRGAALAQSDAEGRFEAWVRRGRLHVYASAEGYATHTSYSSAPGPSLELYLVPEVVLVGRVVDAETGAGVANVAVNPGINPLAEAPMKFVRTEEGWARSDAEGNFRITGLVPGAFQPSVNNGEHRGVAASIVHLGLGETSEPVEVRVTRAGSIRAQVVDGQGQPACAGGEATTSPAMFEFYSAAIDDAGWVELSGLRPADYDVDLHCYGRMFKDVGSFTVAEGGGALDPQTWTLESGLELRGVVVDGRSDPLARVIVVATKVPDPDDRRGRTARKVRSEPSDKTGAFRLRGLETGVYELEIGGSSGPKLPAPMQVEVREPGVEGLRLELPVSGEIRGRVVGEDGNPVANMSVSAYGQNGFQDTHSADEGSFTLTGLGPDSYRVVAVDGRWDIEVGATQVELAAGGSAEAEIVIAANAGVISGRVVDEGGTALDDAFITIERQSEPLDQAAPDHRFSYARFEGKPVLSDPEGAFEISGLPEGLYTIQAKQKQGGEAALGDVVPGQRVELVIPAVASISGTLTLAGSDAPITDYALTAKLADGDFLARAQWRERDGTWAFNRLPPGSYTLLAVSPLGDAQISVELAPGAAIDNQRIELQPRVVIRGRVVDGASRAPIAGAEVRVAAPGAEIMGVGQVERVSTDAEGRFELSVPRGELPLRVVPTGGGHQSLKTTIQVGGEAEQDLGELELVAR